MNTIITTKTQQKIAVTKTVNFIILTAVSSLLIGMFLAGIAFSTERLITEKRRYLDQARLRELKFYHYPYHYPYFYQNFTKRLNHLGYKLILPSRSKLLDKRFW